MATQCQYCGVKNNILPVVIVNNMCKKCTRIHCFQCIAHNSFHSIIESNITQAEYMLKIAKEFKERNPFEYNKIPEITRQNFEKYMELLLWS